MKEAVERGWRGRTGCINTALLLLCFVGSACGPTPAPSLDEDTVSPKDVVVDPPEDTVSPVDSVTGVDIYAEMVIPPPTCEPPDELPAPNLVKEKHGDSKTTISHIVDTEPDPENGLVYAVGFPGFIVYAYDENDALVHTGTFPNDNWLPGKIEIGDVGEYNYLEPLGGNIVVISARGVKPPIGLVGDKEPKRGLYFIDVSNPSLPSLVSHLDIVDAAGLRRKDEYLYVVTFTGMLFIVDISDLEAPFVEKQLQIFKSAWRILLDGDLAYVTDNEKGIVTLDLTDPLNPAVHSRVGAVTGIQDLVLHQGHLYAAVGAEGVQVFSLADPTKPKAMGTYYLGNSVSGVGAAENLLWYVNHEGVGVFDITDPANPNHFAFHETPDWALGVYAFGDQAYVGDWESVQRFRAYPKITAPRADPSPENVYFVDDDVDTRTLTVRNRGSAPLEIKGAMIADPRFQIHAEKLTLAPGEETTLHLRIDDDGEPVNTELCLVTNDPDRPVREIYVSDTSPYVNGAHVGEPADDFVLPEIESGQLYTLSDYFGAPIYLCFFSSW